MSGGKPHEGTVQALMDAVALVLEDKTLDSSAAATLNEFKPSFAMAVRALSVGHPMGAPALNASAGHLVLATAQDAKSRVALDALIDFIRSMKAHVPEKSGLVKP